MDIFENNHIVTLQKMFYREYIYTSNRYRETIEKMLINQSSFAILFVNIIKVYCIYFLVLLLISIQSNQL
jgi:hypothetical protein